jgi:hypothetical protein
MQQIQIQNYFNLPFFIYSTNFEYLIIHKYNTINYFNYICIKIYKVRN